MRFFLFVLPWLFVVQVFAQSLQVDEIMEISAQEDGEFCFPKMGPDGQKIFFTTPHYKGLFYYDMDSGTIAQLNDDAGAGYQFQISQDGKEVYYRSYQTKGLKKYYSLVKQNIYTSDKSTIQNKIRQISPPSIFKSGNIGFTTKSVLNKVDVGNAINVSKNAGQDIVAYVENRKIALYSDDKKTLMQPAGPGIYLWPSVSPDAKQLLFTVAGKGTYISDLEGNIQVNLGYANAPEWSPDGQWIVYMMDHDDGHKMTASELHIVSNTGETKIQLTDTPDQIEIYPSWGNSNKQILFATGKGQIYLMKLMEE